MVLRVLTYLSMIYLKEYIACVRRHGYESLYSLPSKAKSVAS
jgi:hypothetical protein